MRPPPVGAVAGHHRLQGPHDIGDEDGGRLCMRAVHTDEPVPEPSEDRVKSEVPDGYLALVEIERCLPGGRCGAERASMWPLSGTSTLGGHRCAGRAASRRAH